MNLHGISILVTRLNPGGEILCQKIRAAGGRAIPFPTIEILPIQQINIEPDVFDWLIFVSPQAVIHTAEKLRTRWPIFSKKTHIAAIGAGTAAMLTTFNLPVSAVPLTDWRTEGLLQLAEFQQIENKKIAIICGQGGRELLQDTLLARGAKVTKMVAYERALPRVQHKPTEKIDVIVCTSNTGMRNLITLMGETVCTTPVVVISERMKEEAKKLGFTRILLAENASDENIIKGIKL